MKEDILDSKPIKKHRPFSLEILCVITFLITGFLLLFSIINTLQLFFGTFDFDIDRELYQIAIPTSISLILLLIGAINYWYLNKIGLYFIVAGMLFPIYSFGDFTYFIMSQSRFEFWDVAIPLLIILFCLIFLYLFIRHQKYLIK
ncbi:MAG: hypothetical protein ABF242_04870 [Flavobacteriales bacterium]